MVRKSAFKAHLRKAIAIVETHGTIPEQELFEALELGQNLFYRVLKSLQIRGYDISNSYIRSPSLGVKKIDDYAKEEEVKVQAMRQEPLLKFNQEDTVDSEKFPEKEIAEERT